MKLLLGFVVLLVALVAISGCTQQAQPAATVTTTETPAVSTTMETAVATMETTSVPSNASTVVSPPIANVTLTTPGTTVVAPNQTTAAPVITPTIVTATGVTTIHITSAGFNPQVDVVLPGTQIAWINDDTVSHSIKTTGKSDFVFNSGAIDHSAGFTYSFASQTGTCNYTFADNSTITGTIIVKAGRTLSG
jgi:plastocyanin